MCSDCLHFKIKTIRLSLSSLPRILVRVSKGDTRTYTYTMYKLIDYNKVHISYCTLTDIVSNIYVRKQIILRWAKHSVWLFYCGGLEIGIFSSMNEVEEEMERHDRARIVTIKQRSILSKYRANVSSPSFYIDLLRSCGEQTCLSVFFLSLENLTPIHVNTTKFYHWAHLFLGAIGWYVMCWVGYGFNLTDLSCRITIRASNEKKLDILDIHFTTLSFSSPTTVRHNLRFCFSLIFF